MLRCGCLSSLQDSALSPGGESCGQNADLLRTVDVFAQVSDSDLESIAELLEEEEAADSSSSERGRAPGRGCISSCPAGSYGPAATLPAGTSYSTTSPRGSSTARWPSCRERFHQATHQTITDARLLLLRKSRFEDYLAKNVQLMVQLMKVVAQRQAATRVSPPRMETSEPLPPPDGSLFAIYSPKGGVGKSLLAVNLAVALAHQHPNSVALVDLSLTFGHDMLLLNLQPRAQPLRSQRGVAPQDGPQ